jgi:transcriptional regulatory protein LEU3
VNSVRHILFFLTHYLADLAKDSFHVNCARIHILTFHFFAHPTDPGPDAESLARLYSLCISTLQTTHTMTQQSSFALISQSYIDRTICLAGFIILKLVRSPLAAHLDLAAGETAFSHGVQFLKASSMQNNDIDARCASILTNLWGSNRVFRRREGVVESLGLRLRTRLSMSLSFDMFWYWREEFGHMSNPYNGEELAAAAGQQHNAQTRLTTPGKSAVSFFPFHSILPNIPIA